MRHVILNIVRYKIIILSCRAKTNHVCIYFESDLIKSGQVRSDKASRCERQADIATN